MSLTCLPRCVSQCLRVLGPGVRPRPQLVFSWLLVLHLLYGARANLKALARHGPAHLGYQHYRRLVCAASWCTKTLQWWCAEQALQAFPPPEEGVLSRIGDRTLKGKRGQQHPVAQKTRLSQPHPSVFGFRIVVFMAHWGYSPMRIPTASGRRRTSWVYATLVRWRHLGDVTVVLSKCRRNDGPKPTTILVTNLPELVTARQIVAVYLRRWGWRSGVTN